MPHRIAGRALARALAAALFAAAALLAAALARPAAAETPASAFERDPWPASKEGPVKVFILAGQSNMQGHASLRTLEQLIYDPATASEHQHWKDRMGRWTERSDVWIWTTDGDRAGNLRPGFGASDVELGPELGFGWVMGERLAEQVLLIKTCWGGRSVRRDFLPPGAAMPTDEDLARELEEARKRRPGATLEEVRAPYGKAYRDMIAAVKDVLARLAERFPGYDPARGWELAGLVFFQGWNDLVDGAQRAEGYARYTARLAQLIRDARRDLGAPALPVVIGELGVGGERGAFQAAQEAVTRAPDLEGSVRLARTCELWEPEVARLADSDIWKGPDWPRFYNVGSDRAYHYLGSARIFTRMGKAFAQALLEIPAR